MKWLPIIALLACKPDKDKPPPVVEKPRDAGTAAKPRALGLVAEVRAAGIFVAGTRRFAIYAGGWHVVEDGKLVNKPEIDAAVARAGELHGLFDVLLGTTPIVVGGEEHREAHVRVTPEPVEVALDGLATEVVTVGAKELWWYSHELQSRLAIVEGAKVTPLPELVRIGPVPDAASPVSERMCRYPKVVDIAASATSAFALVTECSEEAPIRIVRVFDGATELRLPSRRELDVEPQSIAVARDGTPVVVGVRGAQLAVVGADHAVKTYAPAIKRVISAVIDDDGAVWAKAVDANGDALLLRDGVRVALASSAGVSLKPQTLVVDDTLGVVVYASTDVHGFHWVFAARPPARSPTTIDR